MPNTEPSNTEPSNTEPSNTEPSKREQLALSAELAVIAKKLRKAAEGFRNDEFHGTRGEWLANRVAVTLDQIAQDIWWVQLTPDGPEPNSAGLDSVN